MTKPSTRLISCPFCHSEDLRPYHLGAWWVECFTCLATGPSAKTKEEAIKAWNERKT